MDCHRDFPAHAFGERGVPLEEATGGEKPLAWAVGDQALLVWAIGGLAPLVWAKAEGG